jgi:hypothetical protein
MSEPTSVPDTAPFATTWTCDDCGRVRPWDAWDRATPICVCDEDTIRNYATQSDA